MGNHRGWEVGPSTATEAPEAGWGPPGKRSLPGCSAGPGLSAPHCEVRPLTRAFSSSLPALRCPRLGGRQLSLHGCGLPAKSPASHLASSGTALLAHHCSETRVPSSDGFNHKSEPAQGMVCSRRGPKNNKSRETRQRKQDEGRPKTQAREGAEPAGPRAHSRPRAGGRQHFRREQLPPSRQTQTRLCLTSQDEDVRGLLGGRPPPVEGAHLPWTAVQTCSQHGTKGLLRHEPCVTCGLIASRLFQDGQGLPGAPRGAWMHSLCHHTDAHVASPLTQN